MALSNFNKVKKLSVTSVTGTPTISLALPLKITSGDDSTTGTGEIVLDWTNIASEADIGVYDENDNLLDYYFESFDATNEEAVIWVYRSWVRDDSTQLQIVYGDGPSDQSVSASTVFDKESNLEGGWLLNEDTGDAIDVTSNNNDGTVYGATQGVDGIVDGAYSFDGNNDYIDTTGLYNFTDAITLYASIYTNSITTAQSFLTKYDIPNDKRCFAGHINLNGDGTLMFVLGSEDGTSFAESRADNAIEVNTWYNIVLKWNKNQESGKIRIYKDGSEVNYAVTKYKTDNLNNSDLTAKIGKMDEKTDRFFDGLIDNVRIYSTTHSDDYIEATHDAFKDSPSFFNQDAATQLAQTLNKDLTLIYDIINTLNKDLILKYDIENWYLVETREGTVDSNWIVAVNFNYANTQCAWADNDGYVEILDTSDWSVITSWTKTNQSFQVEYSHDDNWLAIADPPSYAALVYDTSDWSLIATLDDATNLVQNISFSVDDAYLAVGSKDTNLYIYKTSDWSLYKTLSDATGRIQSVHFDENGNYLATASGDTDNKVRIYNATDFTLVKTITESDSVREASFTKTACTYLAVAIVDGNCKIYDVSDWSLVTTLSDASEAWGCDFSYDDEYLAVGGGAETYIYMVNDSWKLLQTLTDPSNDIYYPRFSKNTGWLGTPSVDNHLYLYKGKIVSYTLNADLTLAYDVYELLNNDLTAKYDILNALNEDLTLIYDINNLVNKDLTAVYDLFENLNSDLTAVYDIYNSLNKDLTTVYDILNLVNADLSVVYGILNLLSKDSTLLYDIQNTLDKDLIIKYDILNALYKDLTVVYDILSLVYTLNKDLTLKYDLLNLLSKDGTLVYDINNLAGKEVITKYDILNLLNKDGTLIYDINNLATKDLTAIYNIYELLNKDLTTVYNVFNSLAKNLITVYDILTNLNKDLTIKYDVYELLKADLTLLYNLGIVIIREQVELDSEITRQLELISEITRQVELVSEILREIELISKLN